MNKFTRICTNNRSTQQPAIGCGDDLGEPFCYPVSDSAVYLCERKDIGMIGNTLRFRFGLGYPDPCQFRISEGASRNNMLLNLGRKMEQCTP